MEGVPLSRVVAWVLRVRLSLEVSSTYDEEP